jgi:hypothetical protein
VAASAAAAVALAATALSTATFTPVLAAARPANPAPAQATAKTDQTAKPAKTDQIAKPAKTGQAAKTAKTGKTKIDPVTIVSQYGNGKYMSVLNCEGIDTPPPIRLKGPGTPLTLKGTGPSAGETKAMSNPKLYQKVYKCTIVLEEKSLSVNKPECELSTGGPGSGHPGGGAGSAICHQKITLNTGFGGEAASVASHHPRG